MYMTDSINGLIPTCITYAQRLKSAGISEEDEQLAR
jgi:hypothetical protein